MSDQQLRWCRMDWADLLSGTQEFTDAEMGLYVRILGSFWDRGAQTETQLKKLWPRRDRIRLNTVLAKLTQVGPDMYISERLERERVRAIERSEKAKEIGRLGGIAKSKKLANATISLGQKASERLAILEGEEIRDKEGEKTKKDLPPRCATPPKDKAKKRSGWPKGFTLTLLLRKRAEGYWSQNMASFDTDRVWLAFESHHKSKGTLNLDWDQAWQTWYVKQLDYGTPKSAGFAKSTDGRLLPPISKGEQSLITGRKIIEDIRRKEKEKNEPRIINPESDVSR